MNTLLTGVVPSHRCKTCGALWRFYRAGEGGLPVDSWNLRSAEAGPCCDNVPMGDQIEPLTVELLAQVTNLADHTLDRLIDAWIASTGKPIPWNKAVEIAAIVKRLPDAERDRLLALNDSTPSPAWLLRAERVVPERRPFEALGLPPRHDGGPARRARAAGRDREVEVVSGALTRKEIDALSGKAQVAFCLDKFGTYEEALVRLTEAKVRESAAPADTLVPLDMVLHCPACGKQHIDEPEGEGDDGATTKRPDVWTNPPHRSHLCAGCGHIWRPADVPTAAQPLTTAAADVMAERKRQVEKEGWTPEHDDEHGDQSLSTAAACYALADLQGARPGALSPHYLARFVGWGAGWFKPSDRRRNLIKAAALLLAEIERLDRADVASRHRAAAPWIE